MRAVMSNINKMEINDFGELNALNKLLSKVKFENDLDFYEFREFAGSSIIANIFERLSEQYISECKARGYVNKDYEPKFIFNSQIGTTLKMRLDELSSEERKTIDKNNGVDDYLRTLLVPFQYDSSEFELLRNYYKKGNKSS